MDKGINSFKSTGMMLAGATLCGNAALNIVSQGISTSTVLPIAGGFIVGGILLDRLLKENEYEKIFRMCGLENKDKQIPIIIKKTQKDKETTLVLHLPAGLSQKHFEQKQEELEQYFNAKIEWGFNKNLIMKIIDNNLTTYYPYVFKETKNPLEVYLGETNTGSFYLDIEKSQHIIVGGATDSGKSSSILGIILSLILNKNNIDIHLHDFQDSTLGILEGCKKVKSYGIKPGEFDSLLDEMCIESEKRLKLFRSVKEKVFIDKLSTWNKMYPKKALPYKIVICDEFGRLADKENEHILEKFRERVQMDRKSGIHYIIVLHRCSVDMLAGSIKNNLPTRIAFRTASQVDSNVILDEGGAELLKNQGRCLVKNFNGINEVQTLYVEPKQIRNILMENNALKSKEDIKVEKKANMDKLRSKCINPYLKKGDNK